MTKHGKNHLIEFD